MSFTILSPTFSLFATNILKLYSVIYAPAWLHKMSLLLLNQFLACSAGARILHGKHSVAFSLVQLGGALILGHPYILLCLLSQGLHLVHVCHCNYAEDMTSRQLGKYLSYCTPQPAITSTYCFSQFDLFEKITYAISS